jgi:murein L,D-transpeptidase YafK
MDLRTHLFLPALLFLVSSQAFASDSGENRENSSKNSTPAMPSIGSATNMEPVPAGLIQLPPQSRYYSPYAFVVDKKARTLSVWQQTGNGLKKVAGFPADMGRNEGDKKNRGDAKTPEGIYFLQTRLEGPGLEFKLYGKRAFTTDYPNYFDRMEGKSGSGIWLHAVPDETPLTRGSRGCVVVRNNVILDLTQYVRLGRTPLLIQNGTELLKTGEMAQSTDEVAKWLEQWRAAWQSKNMDAYISAYSSEFKSQHMNRDQWRKFKEKLNADYQTITVKLSKPAILRDRDRIVVRFLQEYTSDQHADFGEKVLFVKREGKDLKIVGENWNEETSDTAHEEIQATMAAAASVNTGPGSDSKSAAHVAN